MRRAKAWLLDRSIIERESYQRFQDHCAAVDRGPLLVLPNLEMSAADEIYCLVEEFGPKCIDSVEDIPGSGRQKLKALADTVPGVAMKFLIVDYRRKGMFVGFSGGELRKLPDGEFNNRLVVTLHTPTDRRSNSYLVASNTHSTGACHRIIRRARGGEYKVSIDAENVEFMHLYKDAVSNAALAGYGKFLIATPSLDVFSPDGDWSESRYKAYCDTFRHAGIDTVMIDPSSISYASEGMEVCLRHRYSLLADLIVESSPAASVGFLVDTTKPMYIPVSREVILSHRLDLWIDLGEHIRRGDGESETIKAIDLDGRAVDYTYRSLPTGISIDGLPVIARLLDIDGPQTAHYYVRVDDASAKRALCLQVASQVMQTGGSRFEAKDLYLIEQMKESHLQAVELRVDSAARELSVRTVRHGGLFRRTYEECSDRWCPEDERVAIMADRYTLAAWQENVIAQCPMTWRHFSVTAVDCDAMMYARPERSPHIEDACYQSSPITGVSHIQLLHDYKVLYSPIYSVDGEASMETPERVTPGPMHDSSRLLVIDVDVLKHHRHSYLRDLLKDARADSEEAICGYFSRFVGQIDQICFSLTLPTPLSYRAEYLQPESERSDDFSTKRDLYTEQAKGLVAKLADEIAIRPLRVMVTVGLESQSYLLSESGHIDAMEFDINAKFKLMAKGATSARAYNKALRLYDHGMKVYIIDKCIVIKAKYHHLQFVDKKCLDNLTLLRIPHAALSSNHSRMNFVTMDDGPVESLYLGSPYPEGTRCIPMVDMSKCIKIAVSEADELYVTGISFAIYLLGILLDVNPEVSQRGLFQRKDLMLYVDLSKPLYLPLQDDWRVSVVGGPIGEVRRNREYAINRAGEYVPYDELEQTHLSRIRLPEGYELVAKTIDVPGYRRSYQYSIKIVDNELKKKLVMNGYKAIVTENLARYVKDLDVDECNTLLRQNVQLVVKQADKRYKVEAYCANTSLHDPVTYFIRLNDYKRVSINDFEGFKRDGMMLVFSAKSSLYNLLQDCMCRIHPAVNNFGVKAVDLSASTHRYAGDFGRAPFTYDPGQKKYALLPAINLFSMVESGVRYYHGDFLAPEEQTVEALRSRVCRIALADEAVEDVHARVEPAVVGAEQLVEHEATVARVFADVSGDGAAEAGVSDSDRVEQIVAEVVALVEAVGEDEVKAEPEPVRPSRHFRHGETVKGIGYFASRGPAGVVPLHDVVSDGERMATRPTVSKA